MKYFQFFTHRLLINKTVCLKVPSFYLTVDSSGNDHLAYFNQFGSQELSILITWLIGYPCVCYFLYTLFLLFWSLNFPALDFTFFMSADNLEEYIYVYDQNGKFSYVNSKM